MVNVRGGKGHKRTARKQREGRNDGSDKRLVYASANEIYAKVLKRLGGTRLEVECSDGKKRNAIIPGKFFKRVWIYPGDILLCDFESVDADSTCYVRLKYNNNEASTLKSQGKINFEITHNAEHESNVKFVESVNVPAQRVIPSLDDIDKSAESGGEDNDVINNTTGGNDAEEIDLDDI